jgi:hypothetical protein
MLFPPVDRVNHVWLIIAHAVATNQLGIGAKVSPKFEHPETKSRLICVYTDDFSNKEDVIRVLQKLKELGLVPGKKPIYYKCGKSFKKFVVMDSSDRNAIDAYTYLNIFSGNEWDIQPSLYSSKQML